LDSIITSKAPQAPHLAQVGEKLEWTIPTESSPDLLYVIMTLQYGLSQYLFAAVAAPLTTNIKDSPGFSSSHTTPSHAPTPINTSFIKNDASNNATPTSATSANKSGAGLKKVVNKKNGEDSETDTKDGKKRTNFGVSRK
jgi:hypothetical protein